MLTVDLSSRRSLLIRLTVRLADLLEASMLHPSCPFFWRCWAYCGLCYGGPISLAVDYRRHHHSFIFCEGKMALENVTFDIPRFVTKRHSLISFFPCWCFRKLALWIRSIVCVLQKRCAVVKIWATLDSLGFYTRWKDRYAWPKWQLTSWTVVVKLSLTRDAERPGLGCWLDFLQSEWLDAGCQIDSQKWYASTNEPPSEAKKVNSCRRCSR